MVELLQAGTEVVCELLAENLVCRSPIVAFLVTGETGNVTSKSLQPVFVRLDTLSNVRHSVHSFGVVRYVGLPHCSCPLSILGVSFQIWQSFSPQCGILCPCLRNQLTELPSTIAQNPKGVRPMSKRSAGSWVFLFAFLLSVPSWAGLFDVSVKKQKELGADAAREIDKKSTIVGEDVKAPLIKGKPIDQIVRGIGEDLARATGEYDKWDFTFKIIKDDQINAFALPGGYIYVYTGLLQSLKVEADHNLLKGRDMLAGVIGHEITHVTGQHWAKQYESDMKRSVGLAVILGATGASDAVQTVAGILNYSQSQKYSRKDEYRADDGGIKLMDKSGKYNPQGMVDMLKMLDKASEDTPSYMVWLSSHPETDDRIKRAQTNVNKLDD
ncbi:MAG: hypothetical protein COS85_00755 [Armatimonadetes bacterium CG07_land_8_20_14_0_80_59_28]|nr:MAG: hypothetical protein COS85_00755 [Armatimonadetes bacterium CG07_land_8_20_14_0_80_59_28]PIX41389.1 MAG: hypothetical protein COZ56_12225 [Armatimonadetes bacterium CG_4_8_14_3_um_filter_58_9]PIY48857.1 MAG: hypothetical protein COZ05_01935 [Armatimonadetes bacterium CG_4_10_14_3_um_filter_59_10]